jgi:uncharacterized protein YyaL (SSP411 family)
MNKTNTLVKEKSPYLLQHATNPVNWYPWEEEAFIKAKEEDKPVFLSIGYSTCHWCHVMEQESFEDMEIAEILNKHFVSVKVDREERPDIDAVYMEVCQAMTGSGGWPMTIIMSGDKKPFFAGTYLPKRNAYNRLGLYELLEYVSSMWSRDRNKLVTSGEKLIEYLDLKEEDKDKHRDRSVPDILDNAFLQYDLAFDDENGGFGSAPKFPTPHNLLFLTSYDNAKNSKKAKAMAEKTLIQMYRGGIFDHIGGGFSRYSTDERWLVPHFEKMLYDNALMIYAYANYIENSENEEVIELFTDIITKTVNYCSKELKGKDGAFYCAQDADIDGKEGEFYLLNKEDIYKVLDAQDADSFCAIYNIDDKGHYEGKSIPNLLQNKSYIKEPKLVDNVKDKLIKFRKNRANLFTDDKILTSWNALIISALAKAGKVLGRETYIKYAQNACAFIEKNLTSDDNILYIRWKDGEKKHLGLLDDYAFYCSALLELYSATYELKYLERASELAETMYKRFSNGENGLYLYSEENEKLILRPKQYHDGAIPSGNSVAANVFDTLFKLTAEDKWQKMIKTQFEAIIPQTEKCPMGYGYSLYSMVNIAYPKPELIVVSPGKPDEKFLHSLRNINILVKTNENKKDLEKIAPFTKNYPIAENVAYFYCYKGVCKQPVYTNEEIKDLVDNYQSL